MKKGEKKKKKKKERNNSSLKWFVVLVIRLGLKVEGHLVSEEALVFRHFFFHKNSKILFLGSEVSTMEIIPGDHEVLPYHFNLGNTQRRIIAFYMIIGRSV